MPELASTLTQHECVRLELVGRTTSIALGTVMVVLGLLAAIAASSNSEAGRDNSRLMIIGGAIAFGGVIRLMSAFSMDAQRSRGRSHLADPSDPRWYGGSGQTQIAGRRCIECGSRITVAVEGVACEVCHEPAHTKCQDQHRAHAHRPDTSGPFR